MLIEHVPRRSLIDEDVSAEAILEDGFGGEEGAPARNHVLTVAVVFYMSDDAFWQHF